MSRRDDRRKQIDIHRRRLQKLEEQQAFRGLDTPVHILIEIEDIKAKIEELRAELKALEDGGIEAESEIHPFELAEVAKPKQRAQIFLQGDFSLLSDDRQSAAIAAFAAVMGISSQEIEVYRVYEGSIVFDLGIPFNAIHRLRSLLQSNSGQLHLLKVEKVILERESGEIEEWTIKEGKFELVTPSRRVTSLPSAQKQSALLRILKATTTLPAQVTLYASALGAIAQAAGAELPPLLAAVAGGVGVNALSNILDRVARGEAVPDEEIRRQVQSAIADSRVDKLLTEEEFQRAVARLHEWQASLGYAIEQQEAAVAERLAQQSREHTALTDELRQLATRQQADEIVRLMKYVLKEEDVKLASSPEKSNRKRLSPAEQYQIALHWAEDIWFEEPLLPPSDLAAETAKELAEMAEQRLTQERALDIKAFEKAADKAKFLQYFVKEELQGILRVHQPRCRLLTAEEAASMPTGWGDAQAGAQAAGKLYLVRLGLEFDVPPAGREAHWAYTNAWCQARLYSPNSQTQPQVLDVYPQRLYDGEPAAIKVALDLGFKAGPVEAKIGQIGTDLHLGQVTPVTVGFLGDEERAPYWELRAKDYPVLGVYHFWLMVGQPPGCGPVRLAVVGEGNLQTRFFIIPVGPKERVWQNRESITLEKCLGVVAS
jgi:hypothetical protein